MSFVCPRFLLSLLISVALVTGALRAQSTPQATSSSASTDHVKKPSPPPSSATLDRGSVSNGVYRNKSLGFSCKIPEGWVLRTEEMNEREGDEISPAKTSAENPHFSQNRGEVGHPAHPATNQEDQSHQEDQSPHPVAESATRVRHPAATAGGKVLLAAFSRPPDARGEEVNASIVIAAESAATYPGLKEAGQYFGPLTEVAQAQGFTVDEEPYEIAIGTKALVRGDFHKDVGTRVMRQSTLAMLTHGYAVSFTVIAGTEDDVEDLIDGLEFAASGK